MANVLDYAQIEALRELAEGAEEGFVDILFEEFRGEAAELTETMRQGRASGDVEAVRRAAHTLKSACAYLGAAALSAECAALEAACREEAPVWGEVASGVERVLAVYDESARALNAVFLPVSGAQTPERSYPAC